MIFYLFYRLGQLFCLKVPLKVSYAVAVFLADIHYMIACRERRAVIENLKVVLSKTSEDGELRAVARDVFRNFAKYLVDFFRFSIMDKEYVKSFIKLEGLSNVDEALRHGKGAIMLSAHLGNWELGGFVMGTLGYQINAVVLTHQHKKINEFFKNQRAVGKMRSIEFGASLRVCYKALKSNELLALLGDRDFSNSGISMEFCGRPAIMPKGPAAFSCRTGAIIVPSFITRNGDDTYTFVFGKPIYPDTAGNEDDAIHSMMKKCVAVIESFVRRYPGQWYVFRNFWDRTDEEMRPNTII